MLRRGDVLTFCTNILNAHRTKAFGGKPALWDFLKDVVANLNRKAQGIRWSENTKAFSQTMKIYGGRQMCDFFQLNFAGPSYKTTKRANMKGVMFIPGEHASIFNCVAEIYEQAKVLYGIEGPVPIILEEDKTKVKLRVAWDTKADNLTGFCGSKENHKCISHFKLVVGEGDSGYSNIVNAFSSNCLASFARVIIVNPLHDKLPKLTLVVSCTCNCFDSQWVRDQWDQIDTLWLQECYSYVGPIIGHASDGGSRRRQFMIKDYKLKSVIRLKVNWEGWVLSAGLYSKGEAFGLHD
jgi:hypothetical protein